MLNTDILISLLYYFWIYFDTICDYIYFDYIFNSILTVGSKHSFIIVVNCNFFHKYLKSYDTIIK